MKFMKLGSRPDTFHTADGVRCVSSEISCDLIVQVRGTRYLLHKFPLLSKCMHLQRLCADSPDSKSPHQIVQLPDFPGGVDAFELCAKFCYGISITLSAYNIVVARCAAEFLQMTEDVEKGNLIYKLEVFFNSCILNGWKDTLVTLQTTKNFQSWAEDLGITSRCIDAIASKVSVKPPNPDLSRSYSRRGRDDASCSGAESHRHQKAANKNWWAEDIAELEIGLYWRAMIAIKSRGKMPASLIGNALKIYASTWLLNISNGGAGSQALLNNNGEANGDRSSRHRLLLESIVSLLPAEKGSATCSFLCKLLKAANILNASSSSRMELARRIGYQLEEATVSDLLIPPPANVKELRYDVDIVMLILEHFMTQGQSPSTSPVKIRAGFDRRQRSRSAENINFELQESRRSSSASHSSKLKVARLVDGYLQEIAQDVKLPLAKLVTIAESVPEFARLEHDGLYRAIDMYLKAHPELNKSERKRLCRVLDCKKLSMEACMHAAQNERLPLRVVVQVLFYEQARATVNGAQVTDIPSNIKALLASQKKQDPSRPTPPLSSTTSVRADDQLSLSGLKTPNSHLSTLRMKLAEDVDDTNNAPKTNGTEKFSKQKSFNSAPTRPKGGMFSKLWSVNRSTSDKN
uniref:NPH3 domain-containing protein n=1 Tax=Kalanchoe fedtschenkoi TaxID=63787 RepID=A0A7N0TET4_KALFE